MPTFCTAAVPRALASLFERFAPYFAAALLVDASRTTYQTVCPSLVPRRSGSVTVWSALTTALRMNWVDEPESASAAGARAGSSAATAPMTIDARRRLRRCD
jgi:hypothetical protein